MVIRSPLDGQTPGIVVTANESPGRILHGPVYRLATLAALDEVGVCQRDFTASIIQPADSVFTS
jgi:hypothetical protein